MSNLTTTQRQALALAGVFQAAQLVNDQATKGLLDHHAYTTCLNSVLITSPETFSQIYGDDLNNLSYGLKALNGILNKQVQINTQVFRYATGILTLQRKLSQQPEMLQALGQRLEVAKSQAEHFGSTHENVVANLASIYQDTLSTFKFRIQVQGDANLLRQTSNADKIRALLLAGIRSAMLWQQSGGSRWQLIFGRRKIQQALSELKLI